MNKLSCSLAALTLTFAAAASQAAPLSALGLDEGVGLLSFGNIDVTNNSVNGSVLAGGNAKISSATVGAGAGKSGVIVAGNLDRSNSTILGNATVGGGFNTGWGAIQGNIAVGGDLNGINGLDKPAGSLTVWGSTKGMQSWYPTVTKGEGEFSLGYDFASAQAHMTSLSDAISGFASTGTAETRWSNNIYFDAAGLSIAIFDIAAADAAKNMQIDNLAAGATVIINVHGDTVDFGSHGYTNFTEGQVLFNLADATSVTVGGGIYASLLAPTASVQANGGRINGQVIAGSWIGSTTIDARPFAGALPHVEPIVDVPTIDPVADVPEPASLALVLGGLLATGSMVRRRKS
jgi:choice-of-anchor A domain-containing protein